MANQEKIDQGDFFYFNWDFIPEEWKYFYHQSHHCFMPEPVYNDFSSRYEKGKENMEGIIAPFIQWKTALKKSYQEIYGCKINVDETTCIRLDEKIHVYYEPYVGKDLDIKKLSDDVIHKIKEAIVWQIEYLPARGEKFCNCIQIVLFFEKDEPFEFTYDFQRQEMSDYIAEDEFMDYFKKIFKCDVGNKENGYHFENPIKGYHLFKQKNI